jgi:hypothetical protein
MKSDITHQIYLLIFFGILVSILISCNDINNSNDSFIKENIYASFSITDTNGVEKNKFLQGEDFILKFQVKNESGKDLHYTYSYPIIVFEIFNEDTVVASSTDFTAYIHPVEKSVVKNNSSFLDEWKGPNTLGRILENQKIILDVGIYKAKVYHGVFFDEYHIPPINDIEFEIIN